MKFGELLLSAGLECPRELENETVSKITVNSKEAVKNSIFICISGAVYDGHDHIGEAVRAGASVIVAEKVRGVCVGGAAKTIFVENTRHAASTLYNRWYGSPEKGMKLIGVTGTNGKTSVSYMLYRIFEYSGYKCGLLGTVKHLSVGGRELPRTARSADMTTPAPEALYPLLLEMKRDGAEYVFMEVSSHALAQCRTDGITFDTSVFTNLTNEHLDFHSDKENYFRAKQKLFLQSRRAVINTDGIYGKRLIKSLHEHDIPTFACSSVMGDFFALGVKEKGTEGISYTLKHSGGIFGISLPLLGDFQVMNSLEAAAVALLCGISPGDISEALAKMGGICGRMELLHAHPKQDFYVIIDYAHTPDALERLLVSVRQIKKDGRIILLFGCGGERDREKRSIMGGIASRLSDLCVITSDNSRREDTKQIFTDILKGVDKEKEYVVIENRKEAIERVVTEYARANDMVILAGKGHENYIIDALGKHHFDEREAVRNALLKHYSTN